LAACIFGVLAFRFTAGRSGIGDPSDEDGVGSVSGSTNLVHAAAHVTARGADARIQCRRMAITYAAGNGNARLIAERIAPRLRSFTHPADVVVRAWPPVSSPAEPLPDVYLFLHEAERTQSDVQDGTRIQTRVRASLGSGLVRPPPGGAPRPGFGVELSLDIDLTNQSTFRGWSRENARRVAIAHHIAERLGHEFTEQWTQWVRTYGLLNPSDDGLVPSYREPGEAGHLAELGFRPVIRGSAWLSAYQSFWIHRSPGQGDPLPSWRRQLKAVGWTPDPGSQDWPESAPLRMSSQNRTLWIWQRRLDQPFDAVATCEAATASGGDSTWCALLAERLTPEERRSLIEAAWHRRPAPLASLALLSEIWTDRDREEAAAILRRVPPSNADEAWLAVRIYRQLGDERAARVAVRAARLLCDLGPTPQRVADAITADRVHPNPSEETGDQPTADLLRGLGFIELNQLGLGPATRTIGYHQFIAVFREEPDALRIGSVWLEPDRPASGESPAVRAVTVDMQPPFALTTTRQVIALPAEGETKRLARFSWAEGVDIEFERQSGRFPFVVYLRARDDDAP
jgi:hypothetical protein